MKISRGMISNVAYGTLAALCLVCAITMGMREKKDMAWRSSDEAYPKTWSNLLGRTRMIDFHLCDVQEEYDRLADDILRMQGDDYEFTKIELSEAWSSMMQAKTDLARLANHIDRYVSVKTKEASHEK